MSGNTGGGGGGYQGLKIKKSFKREKRERRHRLRDENNLKLILNKQSVKMCTGLIWFRIGSG
jgi:hypothetical protein